MGLSGSIVRARGGAIHRGPRRKVLIRAQMRVGGARVDICIRDISPRDMLVQAVAPPHRGTLVELACAGLPIVGPIVGQVVWAGDRRFGIAVRDVIDVRALIDAVEGPGAGARPPPRPASRLRRGAANARATFDGSRDLANAFQFMMVVGACTALAFVLAAGLYAELSNTLGNVSTHL